MNLRVKFYENFGKRFLPLLIRKFLFEEGLILSTEQGFLFWQQPKKAPQQLRLQAESRVRQHKKVEHEVECICYAAHVTQPRQQIIRFTFNNDLLLCQVYNETGVLAAALWVLVQVSCPCAWLRRAKVLPEIKFLRIIAQP